MSCILRSAALAAACIAALATPVLSGSCQARSTATDDVLRQDDGDFPLRALEDRLAELGEQAKQVGDDAVAAGRAALDAGLAKLRERETARRHGKGGQRPGGEAFGVEIGNI